MIRTPCLRRYSANLLLSIPLGTTGDSFAGFSEAPTSHFVQGKDAWDQVGSQVYRQAVGIDKTPMEIASIIRWGRYGMDGFCSWTAAYLNDLQVPSELVVLVLELFILGRNTSTSST